MLTKIPLRSVRPIHAVRAVGRRCLQFRGASALRFLLVWPLIRYYRECVRRSLRWRLAESHVGTVLLSVLVISVVGAAAVVGWTLIRNPIAEEPSREASWVAEAIMDLGWTVDDLREPQASTLLALMATGKIGPNEFDEDVNLLADVGKRLQNIQTISVVGQDRRVIASSDPALVNQSAILINSVSLGVADRALGGSSSVEQNTVIRTGLRTITGAYPLRDGEGSIIGAIVVAKSASSLPTGWKAIGLALEYSGDIALTIALLVGIPAIPVGVVIGIRRAQAIGRPISELATVADLLAQQRLDVRVRVQGEDEIGLLGERFNQMADRLQESLTREGAARARAEALLAANKELIANVSHELRTPVALVRAHIESLADEPERCEDYARIALRETDRLERLVHDLFDLTRVENKVLQLEREPFDVGAAVREATESLVEPTRREAGIVLKAMVEGDDLRSVGDRARLVQVLQNLIRNAVRFTPEGGIILVGAQADGDAVNVTVQDTGSGIPPDDLPHVFDRFYRGERSRNRAAGGAGLGLAIARQLVEAMGGQIGVESVVGEGSTFTIRLPRADQAPVSANGTASGTADAAHGRSARVGARANGNGS